MQNTNANAGRIGLAALLVVALMVVIVGAGLFLLNNLGQDEQESQVFRQPCPQGQTVAYRDQIVSAVALRVTQSAAGDTSVEGGASGSTREAIPAAGATIVRPEGAGVDEAEAGGAGNQGTPEGNATPSGPINTHPEQSGPEDAAQAAAQNASGQNPGSADSGPQNPVDETGANPQGTPADSTSGQGNSGASGTSPDIAPRVTESPADAAERTNPEDNQQVINDTSTFCLFGQFGSTLQPTSTQQNAEGSLNPVGLVFVTVDFLNDQICFDAAVGNVTLPAETMSIQVGEIGTSGPAVVIAPQAPDENGVVNQCTSDYDQTAVNELVENPSSYYVTVGTADQAPGAIRAQLEAYGGEEDLQAAVEESQDSAIPQPSDPGPGTPPGG